MRQVEVDPTGRYIRYDEILGRGSYKIVFKAFDSDEAVEVAWNKLQVERIPEEQIEKLQFEVELLGRLKHKNIINLCAAWQGRMTQGKQSIDFITELMSSGTLKDYLTRSKVMKLKVIRRWCHNLLEAITYLHEKNPPIMHRDLKCDNIFINGHCGEVKIGDLGLSGVKHASYAQSVIGTPEFMAPELYEEAYTEKVDIYAFGMCMLEMLTMEYPYMECANPAQIFRKVFSGERPLSFKMLPDSEVKQVIAACLEKERRRPTARQLLEHPFFADWASDDGMLTNRDVCGSKSFVVPLTPGQSAISKRTNRSNAGGPASPNPMSRNANPSPAKSNESYDNVRAPKVTVNSEKEGPDLRIALSLVVAGVFRTVEFFFDPEIDDLIEVSRELALEFDLDSEAAAHMYRELSRGIKSYVYGQQQGSRDEGDYEDRRDLRANSDEHASRNLRCDGAASDSMDEPLRGSSYYQQEHEGQESGDTPSQSVYLSDQEGHGNSREMNSEEFNKALFQDNMVLLEHCSKGNLEIVESKLENGAKADFVYYDFRTPMHLAATEGHHDVVKLLIKRGADIDAEDRWGSTPVNDAEKNGHEKVVEVLREAGARIDTRTISREEIKSMELMQYAANGFYDMVREKLMAGAKATFADYDKRTALHLTCSEGHHDVTRLLLINGADAMFKDRFGATPTDEAMKNGNEDLLPMLKQYGGCLPWKVLSKGEAQYCYGMDLVHHASRGRADRVHYLVEQGADVTFADYDKRSSLHLACAEGHVEVALVLLREGACMNFKDRWGVSSLDEAKKNGHEELVTAMEAFAREQMDKANCDKENSGSLGTGKGSSGSKLSTKSALSATNA